eukprot:5855943-Pyramimonas_sp.AAC.1
MRRRDRQAPRLLGTMVADDGSPGVDVVHKVAKAAATTIPLRRDVHKRKQLTAHHKAALADSVMLSELACNACTWPPLGPSDAR